MDLFRVWFPYRFQKSLLNTEHISKFLHLNWFIYNDRTSCNIIDWIERWQLVNNKYFWTKILSLRLGCCQNLVFLL